VWGLVFPLMTKADGSKYGKTAAGTVWLDAARTSPYRFYQFFVNTDDADVIALLKMLTFRSKEDIADLETALRTTPEARVAPKALAHEMTALVHGETAVESATRASEILFGGSLDCIPEAVFADVVGEVPTTSIDRERLRGTGILPIDLFVHAGLSASKGQARRDLEGGGLYLNNARYADVARPITSADMLFGKYLLLRKGRRAYALLTASD
jgi:tyrosyl-tRNA synthetase